MPAIAADVGKYMMLSKNDPDTGTVAGDYVMVMIHRKDPSGCSPAGMHGGA